MEDLPQEEGHPHGEVRDNVSKGWGTGRGVASLSQFLSGSQLFCVAKQTFVYQTCTLSYACELLPFFSDVSDPYPILLSSG